MQVLRRGLAAAPWERQKAVLTVLILRIELFLEEIGCAACESKVYDNEERRKGINVENDFAGKACFGILQRRVGKFRFFMDTPFAYLVRFGRSI